ncbi:MAPEG family protein, partial [Sphingopyxis granuli]|uniref:MAPEG family protein n=1 Tax=Sphingopyxis granuli TaxID=267128 RepID=UPI000958084D
MDTNAILGPVATLALWSMVMWVWMYATRIPAMSRAKIDAAKMVGGTGKNLDEVLPAEVQWKAHNYNHLMEQPTVFYAVALALAVGGLGGGLNAQLAWAYVGLRILHSLIQATVNRVMWRFAVFALASLALLALGVHAFIGFVV